MNIQSRENEDTLQELEKIRNICSNALEKVDTLLATQFNPTTIDYPLDKEKLLEDVTFISNSLSTAMNMTDPLFRHYFVIPYKTEDENLPFYLMTMKNDSLIKYEKKLIEKDNINEEDEKLMAIDMVKENETRIKNNINRLSKNLCDKINEYRKKNKMVYKSNESNEGMEVGNKKLREEIMENYKKKINY